MIERASDLPENDQNTRIKLESDERRKDGKALTKSIKRAGLWFSGKQPLSPNCWVFPFVSSESGRGREGGREVGGAGMRHNPKYRPSGKWLGFICFTFHA